LVFPVVDAAAAAVVDAAAAAVVVVVVVVAVASLFPSAPVISWPVPIWEHMGEEKASVQRATPFSRGTCVLKRNKRV